MIRARDMLGVGIYSPAEAALYARVQTQLVTRWLYGTARDEPVIQPQLGEDEKTVSFLDFVQAMAIRQIRNEARIPMSKVREAYLRARADFGVEYPFALDHTRIGRFGPPDKPKYQDIWICIDPDDKQSRKFFQLTGKKFGSQLIGEVVLTYAERLTYNDAHLATEFIAWPAASPSVVQSTQQILMNPDVRFGEPYLSESGYTASTLYDAYRCEGSIEQVADLYEVSPDDVRMSIDYFDYLKPPTAA